MTPFIVSVALAVAVNAAPVADPDSIAAVHTDSLKVSAIMLRDVEIVADNVRTITDGIAATPTRRERRAATGTGGEGLLRRMQPPMLSIDPVTGKVKMDTGEDVTYFINGVQASEREIATMRTRDVQRVEILRRPTDPIYHGVVAAINFVVVEPDYGGYVTAYGQQRFGADYMGHYSLYGRYTHGAHTFQMIGGFDPTTSHGSLTDTRTTYHMTRADGTPYDLVRDESATETAWHQRRYSAGMQWTWRGKNRYVTSSTGITYEDNPRADREGTVAYSTGATAPQSMIFRSWSHYCMPYWDFKANFTLPRNNAMYVSANISLSDNNTGSSYEASELTSPLLNNTDETGVSTSLKIYYAHTFAGGNKLEAEIDGRPKFYNVHYSGTATEYNRLRQDYYEASLAYTHSLPGGWRGTARVALPYMGVYVRDGASNHDIVPEVSLRLNGSIGSKHILAMSGEVYTAPRRIGSFNDVDQDINEIEGTGGNEYLKRETTCQFTGSYTWLLARWINFGASAVYEHIADHVVQDYIQKGDMMYNTLVNSGDLDRLSLALRSTVTLLDSRLMISPGLEANHYRQEGVYPYNFWNLNGSASAYYYPTDRMSFGIMAMTPSRMIGTGTGAVRDMRSWMCYFDYGYFTDDLRLGLTVNPFYRYFHERRYFAGKNISSMTNSLKVNGARYVEVSVSYTFDYGRKVRRGGEMYINSSRTSSTR